ncbi:MAG: hypothetical protein A3I05_03720 [Deltaproteobacteria bacterium RIFCSPLOWO2_02_FULL_44_10]|nr:MAG: hypothetical protein A3C46_07830 [Deltaproteobacteria bacterium RIFCSPHIGHO2_02_FULL_44_16]OGQ47077.1 MAG: hypothetical protein A3I05_03720 [Deltaproteobacteria bacterium RIFCSPLOWO2_02_FULL_44_10]
MARNDRNGFDFAREIWGILFLALGLFFTLSLASYSPTDPALNSATNVEQIGNLCGIIGAYVADILLTLIGVSSYITAALFFLLSFLQFFGKTISFRLRDILFASLLIAFVSTFFHLRFETINMGRYAIAGGGIVGGLLGQTLISYVNRPGAYIVSSALILLFFLLTTQLTISALFLNLHRALLWCTVGLWHGLVTLGDHLPDIGRIAVQGLRRTGTLAMIPFQGLIDLIGRHAPMDEDEEDGAHTPVRIERPTHHGLEEDEEPDDDEEDEDLDEDDDEEEDNEEEDEDLDEEEDDETEGNGKDHNDEHQAGGPKISKRPDLKKKIISDSQLKFLQMNMEGYDPPPLSLLDTKEGPKAEIDETSLKKNSLLLEKKLTDFEVRGRVTAIHPGPVITMYEFEPAPGMKVNKVVNLEDDLSLALGGRSVRIIPHLPGKAAVGIEVPNHEREIVWLKNIIASTFFQRSSNKIPLALGTNTEGKPVVLDLTRMPHILIAGATGAGKSVAINTMIMSLLYKMSPEDCRLLLIDPKMLELSVYEGIPHLLLPVVTKPKQAISAMRWATKEMERRYRLMADSGTRNIAGYNEKMKKKQIKIVSLEKAEELTSIDPEAIAHTGVIPYIVIIIDELADLMMTSSQEMEETITRLAQMARAAGIHLILATQRPSVDVVTGLIKANFPARMAFKVTARHDSRTILDSMGAEQLLGAGDMLFMSPTGGTITRHHGCLVTESEIARVVTHLKQQGKPIYDESILTYADRQKEIEDEEFTEEDDELYDRAVQIVTDTRQASISMIQRRMRIGYNRAARMIERMQSEGIVGPPDGSKPREVIGQRMEK